MKKSLLILSFILILLLGVFAVYKLNANNYALWNSNTISVSADAPLSVRKVKIHFGISMNAKIRSNDTELFSNLENSTLLFDGEAKEDLINEYGENDFLITYNNTHNYTFRQFKTNRSHQHNYNFHFYQKNKRIYLRTEIKGNDAQFFIGELHEINKAKEYKWNKSLTSQNETIQLLKLPKAKPNGLDRKHLCYDIYNNQNNVLPNELKKQGLTYSYYTFDTMVHGKRLIYSYRLLGSSNKETNETRIFSCLQNDFEATAKAAKQGSDFACYYGQQTDSLVIKWNKVYFTCYSARFVGGAGVQETKLKYCLPLSVFKKLLLDTDLVHKDALLKPYLIEEKYF